MRTLKENPTTKEKLLDTAQCLMLAKGYTATSVEEICKAASLTKGSFFHYFASKEDLGKAVLERYVNTVFRAIQGAPFMKKRDPLQRLYGYVDFMVELSKDPARRSGCLLGNFSQVLTDTHPDIRTQCEAHFRLWSDMLKQELEAAKSAYQVKELDTGSLADHFIALLEGSLMLAKTRRNPNVVANNLDHFKDYLKAIFKK